MCCVGTYVGIVRIESTTRLFHIYIDFRFPFSIKTLSFPLSFPLSLTTTPLPCYCAVEEPVSEQIPPITTIRYIVRCAVSSYRSRSSSPGFFFLPVMWSLSLSPTKVLTYAFFFAPYKLTLVPELRLKQLNTLLRLV